MGSWSSRSNSKKQVRATGDSVSPGTITRWMQRINSGASSKGKQASTWSWDEKRGPVEHRIYRDTCTSNTRSPFLLSRSSFHNATLKGRKDQDRKTKNTVPRTAIPSKSVNYHGTAEKLPKRRGETYFLPLSPGTGTTSSESTQESGSP